ncbi:MAG: Gfo/Idh/MocA family oxidoreductase, partial [Planctomycetaceae bacterium]|nr:Gfo/Idh/MocA family oxidoreductase [Planctomycetaceae bacterium]
MISRRDALRSTLSFAGAAYLLSRHPNANGFTSPNARPRIGVVGSGSRWYIRATGINADYGSAPQMRGFGDYVAICDVDSRRRESAASIVKDWTGTAPSTMLDYRELLDDDSIDIVHISTPDHWHAKIAIEAMLAGKDVYCEKPMTLTIEEGRQMCDVCKRTGRIVQVGTQQRSGNQFLQAIALIRAGRLGDIKKATCSIGGAPTSPQLP